jgi:hypothetical protein
MNWWMEVWQNILATVLGGFLFAFLLYVINEYFFKNSLIFKGEQINGLWKVETVLNKTSINKNVNLKIEFKIHLVQVGSELKGIGEKIRDYNPDGTIHTEYEHSKRTRIKISGNFEKNYFKKSKIYLLVEEFGRIRTTSTNFELIINRKNMKGTFTSTAANSFGSTIWEKIG